MTRSAPDETPPPRGVAVTSPPDPGSRYELLEKVAAGGMATVYVGRQRGAEGFWRLVAIKRPHQHLLDDPAFRRMFVEEARLASKIHHPHVVPVLDVEERTAGQLLLVMDYVEGGSLAELMDAAASRGRALPARVAVRIALDALAGLHAAHELTDAAGRPLRLVHRDVSPHNILVGIDGTSRVTDFGIAKSVGSKSVTESGVLKGKLAYMAPEYVTQQVCTPRSDVFGMAVVTWEALAGKRLFRGESDYDTLRKIVDVEAPLISSVAPALGNALDAVLAVALERDAARRTPTARAFAEALEAAARRSDLVATTGEVSDHLREAMATPLSIRRERLRRFLDAGGTTGPMVSTVRAVPTGSHADGGGTPPRPAHEDAGSVVPAARLEEAPISAAMTNATAPEASEATARALVAAGIRPQRRSGSAWLAAGFAVLLGGGSAFWLFRPTSGEDAAPGGSATPTPPSADPTGAVGTPPSAPAATPPTPAGEPTVAPVEGAQVALGAAGTATPPPAAAASSPTPPLTTGSGGPPQAPRSTPPPASPPPASQPPASQPPASQPPASPPPASTPPASAPTGPIKQNPYR